MKKLLVTALVLAIGVLVALPYASAISTPYTGADPTTAGIGINGTVHDLRRHNTQIDSAYYSTNASDYLDRICIFCHAPHHAYKENGETRGTGETAVNSNYTYLPLWNHVQTSASFVQYNPGVDRPDAMTSMKGAQSIDASPVGDAWVGIGAVSLLCLSCHDGSIAVNSFGNDPQDARSQSRGTKTINLEYQIGFAGATGTGFLANHHPVGFNYNTVAAFDLEIIPSDTAVFNHDDDIATYGAVTGAINVGGPKLVQEVLWNGRMECSSCHAVHNTGNTGEKLLYVSDQNSNLCLSCHLKGTKTIGTWDGTQITGE